MDQGTTAPLEPMGQPVPRYEARAKVTGAARYASDEALPGIVYAYTLGSRIAKGRIKSIDLRQARALSGVLDILTYETIGSGILPMKHVLAGGGVTDSVTPLASAEIAYAGQIIAMVLAETYETARDAAIRIHVDYEEESPAATFGTPGAVEQPLAMQRTAHEDPSVGDFAAAYAAAAVKIDACYSTPTQHHNSIELYATYLLLERIAADGVRTESKQLWQEIWVGRAAWH